MKTIKFLAIIVATLFMGTAIAQITPSIQRVRMAENEKAVLDQYIRKYTAFTIDKRELTNHLDANGGTGKFQLRIDDELDWVINVELNDMRYFDYKSTYTTEDGTFEITDPFVVNTYKGMTSDNQIVRFTIDESTFFGVIFGDDYHYVIRPVADYTKNSRDNTFIVYKSWDIIPDDGHFDYVDDALTVPIEGINELSEQSGLRSFNNSCTYFLIIATDADYEFHLACGAYSAASTNSSITSVLNIAEGAYESKFGLRFFISYQNVYTTSSQPYTSYDASTLCSQFQGHWNTDPSLKNEVRNIAHLFTGKTLNGGAVWGYTMSIGALHTPNNPSNSNAYGLSMERQEMYQTTTHEIGHSLGAWDNPIFDNCQCGNQNASVMCQGYKAPSLWFCLQSSLEISSFLNSNTSLLASFCGPKLLCLGVNDYFTISHVPSGISWTKSSNINMSGSGSSVTVSGNANGPGWVGVTYNGVLFKYDVWVGVPSFIQFIDGPQFVVPIAETNYYAYSNQQIQDIQQPSFQWTLNPMNGSGFNYYKDKATVQLVPGSYTLSCTVSNVCGSSNTVSKEIGSGMCLVSPNPFSSSITLTFNTYGTYSVSILDYLSGSTVYGPFNFTGYTTTETTSGFPNGLYLLKVVSFPSGKTETQPIIKN